jgi:hypothetical protein
MGFAKIISGENVISMVVSAAKAEEMRQIEKIENLT